jgi:acyl-coenzyme A synthetase/AMP-(fatty) acid ligase
MYQGRIQGKPLRNHNPALRRRLTNQLLLISPRNTVEADLAVIERSKCGYWILPTQYPDHLDEVFARHPMKIIHVAEADDILSSEPVPHFAYDKTFEEAKSEPFCVLHTSGSTGHPKPIIWKHSLLATLDASRLLPEHEGRPPWVVIFGETDRFYSAFPFYHVSVTLAHIERSPRLRFFRLQEQS